MSSLRNPLATLRRLRRPATPAGDASRPASGHELRYWRERGLDKGTYIYENYLKLFGLERGSLSGKTVCDYGSGPFGGVLSALDGIEGYPST